MKFLEKVIVAVFSSVILSLSLAFLVYTPEAEQQAGVGYSSFMGLFILYVIYSMPVYVIGGGLYSLFADAYIAKIPFRKKLMKYITGCFIYGIGGLFIIGLILFLDSNYSGLDIFRVFVFGALAALLFFHISLIWKKTSQFLRNEKAI